MKQESVLDCIDRSLDTICASPLTHGTLMTVEFSCLLLLTVRRSAMYEAGDCPLDLPDVQETWKAQILSKFVVGPAQTFPSYLEGLNLELPEQARLLTTELRNLRARLDLPQAAQVRQWVPAVIPWSFKDVKVRPWSFKEVPEVPGMPWPEAIAKLQKHVPNMPDYEIRRTLENLLERGQLELDKHLALLYRHSTS